MKRNPIRIIIHPISAYCTSATVNQLKAAVTILLVLVLTKLDFGFEMQHSQYRASKR
jgi:hypothetical protein